MFLQCLCANSKPALARQRHAGQHATDRPLGAAAARHLGAERRGASLASVAFAMDMGAGPSCGAEQRPFAGFPFGDEPSWRSHLGVPGWLPQPSHRVVGDPTAAGDPAYQRRIYANGLTISAQQSIHFESLPYRTRCTPEGWPPDDLCEVHLF